MSRGILITLEGPDGSGKSTQIANIKKYFLRRGKTVVVSREPGGTNIGEKLREIVLDKDNGEMDEITEMMIYAAARAQHVAEKIRPALEKGKVIICDRFTDSSIAYQGYGRELGKQVAEVNFRATGGLEPDITFFMDVDPQIGRNRIEIGERDRLEQEQMDFHYRVYRGYCALCKANPQRIIRIDATKNVENVKMEIYHYLDQLPINGVIRDE